MNKKPDWYSLISWHIYWIEPLRPTPLTFQLRIFIGITDKNNYTYKDPIFKSKIVTDKAN